MLEPIFCRNRTGRSRIRMPPYRGLCEFEPGSAADRRGRPRGPDGLAVVLAGIIREVAKMRREVAFRNSGKLPNDGKVIEDAKKYE